MLLPLRSRRASGHVGGLLPEQVALAHAKQEAEVALHYSVLALARLTISSTSPLRGVKASAGWGTGSGEASRSAVDSAEGPARCWRFEASTILKT